MVDTNKLRGIIAENGKSQAQVAKDIGITPLAFYRKMKRGVFNSNEIELMMAKLHIENPVPIFFNQKVSQ